MRRPWGAGEERPSFIMLREVIKIMQEITVTRTTTPRERVPEDQLGFGKVFSDHMFMMNYDAGEGWLDPRIVPYGPIELMPCANVLHYAQEIFEGLKAYRTAQGHIQLFRPTENIARMNNSAARLCIPHIPEDVYLEGMKRLVAVDADWVPHSFGTSLYLRPFVIATDAVLGVHAGNHYLFCIICSPSGSYYAEGINPVKILIESRDVRAVRGGTGYAKCGGNYAASMRAGQVAEQKGFSQVLWLDGVHMKYIEEVGAMNVMFKIGGKIITPDISGGSVLPGITRKSCIQVLRDWGYAVEERELSVEELIEASENGTLEEAWGCGTAAVISPIGLLAYQDKEHVIAGGKIGALTQRLYDELTGIQWGVLPDTRGWIVSVI